MQAYDHIYESLTGYDEKTNIVPCLAQSWDISNDGKTYTFKLRPNVKFHNGQIMTAEDVKYSIDRVMDPKTASPWRSWFDMIKEIKVVDPLTVQMTMDAPYPILGSFAGMRASGIIPKGLAERENLKIKGIGTGPFKLVEYVPQEPGPRPLLLVLHGGSSRGDGSYPRSIIHRLPPLRYLAHARLFGLSSPLVDAGVLIAAPQSPGDRQAWMPHRNSLVDEVVRALR